MRPLIAAEPMLRAPRPDTTPESKRAESSASTGVAASRARVVASARAPGLKELLYWFIWAVSLLRRRVMEQGIVEFHVGLGLLDAHLLVLRLALAAAFEGEGHVHALDALVV